ncbi:MAG: hypothetical protein HS129_15115 [Leptospiraceae bacterium]|nr:hypothetical protein [Leptospiraceae bacterium]
MGIIEKIKSFFKADSSSDSSSFIEFASVLKPFVEQKQEILNFTNKVYPDYPVEMLDTIEKLVLITPDLSQALKRVISIGNTGLTWDFSGVDDKAKVNLQNEIDSWFDLHPGILNRLIRQTAITGALSAEAVPNLDLSEVEEIRLIPVKNVVFEKQPIDSKTNIVDRFKFVPMQKTKNGTYATLNPEIYSYEAIENSEESPYGIPPFISALKWVLSQHKTGENVDKHINKWGLLGFIVALFKKPAPKPGTPNADIEKENRKFLKEAKEGFEKNSGSGFMAAFDGTKIEHHSVASDKSGGFSDIARYQEEQIASGIDTDLFILGRSYSVTESYAKIAGRLFQLKAQNIRHPAKRFLEKALTLHLRLKGYKFGQVKGVWKSNLSLDPLAEAQADESRNRSDSLKIDNVLKKIASGIIDPDTGAQELGYESATKIQNSQNALKSILSQIVAGRLSYPYFPSMNTNEHYYEKDFGHEKSDGQPKRHNPDENPESDLKNLINVDFEKKKRSQKQNIAVS